MKFVGEPLRNTRFVPARYLGDLTKARMPLTAGDLAELARGLDVGVDELSRALTDDETAEWAFYRVSATNVSEIWRHAHRLWKRAGLSNADAARIIGINKSTLFRCLTNEDPFAMTFDAATRLSDALNLDGPNAILPATNIKVDHHPSR